MIPFLAQAATPIIQSLMANGLTTLADAVAAKGKEAVENIIGVKLGDQVRPEDALLLKQLEFDHEEKLRQISLEERKLDVAAEQAAGEAVTKRWEADLNSDNKFSKNIRPGTLAYLLLAVTVLAILDSIPSAGFSVKQVWVDLFSDALQVVLFAYFVARSGEKMMDMWRKK